MAYTAGFSVTVGNPTKASDVDVLAANDDYLKTAVDKIMADAATPSFALRDGVTATTQSSGNNSTKLATTAYADAATISFANDENNRVVTGTGSGLNGEANLTFDGSTLTVAGNEVITGQSISVGEAPSTWGSAFDFVQIGGTLALASQPGVQASQAAFIVQNAHYDSDGSWEYQATDEASRIGMSSANITFDNAASGTAGNDITWSERMRIDSAGKVGIGTAAPGTLLHIKGESGITIDRTANGAIEDKFQIDVGQGGSLDCLQFNSDSTTRIMSLTKTGLVGIGTASPTQVLDVNGSAHVANILYANDSANGNMTVGATFNQGSNSNEIFAAKSSTVAHGMTTITETDTYYSIKKANPAEGAVNMNCMADGGAYGLIVNAVHVTSNTTKSTGAQASVWLQGAIKSGTGKTNLGADGNLCIIADTHLARFIFDVEGSSHQDVGTAWINFDDHDDVALTRSLGIALDPASIIQNKWDDWGKDHFKEMEDFGLIGKVSDEGKAKGERGLVNMTLLAKLHNGAIGQLGAALNDMKEIYEDKIAALESRLMRLED